MTKPSLSGHRPRQVSMRGLQDNLTVQYAGAVQLPVSDQLELKMQLVGSRSSVPVFKVRSLLAMPRDGSHVT